MNKWMQVFVLVMGLMLVFIGLAPGYQAQEPGEGFVYQLTGQVQILHGPWWNFWAWEQVEPGTELMAGDRLRVGAASFAEVELYNQTHLRVVENTLLIIGESDYVEYDYAQERVRTSSVRLQRGQVWVKVEKAISKMLKFKVETPNSVAGVRGTSFVVKVQDKNTELLVDEGLVEIRQKSLTDQSGTLVAGGFQVQVVRDHQPTAPIQLHDEERQELRAWVKRVKEEAIQRRKSKEDVEKARLEKEKEKAEKRKAKEEQDKEDKESRKSSDEKHQNRGKGSERKDQKDDDDDDDEDDEDDDETEEEGADDHKVPTNPSGR